MRFTWDPNKEPRNKRDHGIGFQEATTVFGDALAMTVSDADHSVGQERFVTIGYASGEIPRIPLNLVLVKGVQILGFQFQDVPPDEFARNEGIAGGSYHKEAQTGLFHLYEAALSLFRAPVLSVESVLSMRMYSSNSAAPAAVN